MRLLSLAALLGLLLILPLACANKLFLRESYRNAETLPVEADGTVSLPGGESLSLEPIFKQEQAAAKAKLSVMKLYGNYLLTGDGYQHVWVIEPSDEEEGKYWMIKKLLPGPGGFAAPKFRAKTGSKCVRLTWKDTGVERQVWLDREGDFDENTCPED